MSKDPHTAWPMQSMLLHMDRTTLPPTIFIRTPFIPFNVVRLFLSLSLSFFIFSLLILHIHFQSMRLQFCLI